MAALGQHWAPWWKARAAEGHELPHIPTITPIGAATCLRRGARRFCIRPSAGALPGEN